MRGKSRRLALVAALALLVLPTAAHAGPPKWLVELDGAPVADGTSRRARRRAPPLSRRGQKGRVRYHRRFSYSTLFNGLSVSASKAAATEIGDLDTVKAVHAVRRSRSTSAPRRSHPTSVSRSP